MIKEIFWYFSCHCWLLFLCAFALLLLLQMARRRIVYRLRRMYWKARRILRLVFRIWLHL